MDARRRDAVAAVVAALALLIGIGIVIQWRNPPMATIGLDADGHVIVTSVDPDGDAARNGIRPGMLVVSASGVEELIRFPQEVIDPRATPDPMTDMWPPGAISYVPEEPEFVPVDPVYLEPLLSSGFGPNTITDIAAIDRSALELGTPQTGWAVAYANDARFGWQGSAIQGLAIGSGLWVVIAWWLGSGRTGETMRRMAIPLATATAVPFLVLPLPLAAGQLAAIGTIVTVAGLLPLADALASVIADRQEAQLVRQAAIAGAVASALLAVALAMTNPNGFFVSYAWALLGAISLIPGLAAAAPASRAEEGGAASGRLLDAAEYAVVGATPVVALVSATNPPSIVPLLVWLLGILIAGRFTVRPLVRLASRATLQRDLVVAATEAERARVAADIHDDALQELTLLVHQLDAKGDTEGAEVARTIAERLRAICGDLRLPILDDLGVGPALDWLVLRIERLAGGEVRLERADGTRPPAAVELAFFRVAQEALANAVKHGKPPIVVRYATSAAGASLSIDDAGPGIEPGATDAAATPDQPQRFGLVNMQQRAEAIGAILDVRRWPNGGTHVALEWRAA